MRIERVQLMYDITPAQLIYKRTPPEMQISITHGQMQIENDPLRLELDNKQFFDSINIKSIQSQASDQIQQGKEAALEAAGRYAKEKTAMTGPDAVTMSQLVAQQGQVPVQMQLAFLPAAKPKTSWSGGDVKVQFTKDKIEITWTPHKMEFTYVPYSVKYHTEKQ